MHIFRQKKHESNTNYQHGIFMKRQEWKEKAAEMSGVPKDVAMGLPILTITGTNDLCVENTEDDRIY